MWSSLIPTCMFSSQKGGQGLGTRLVQLNGLAVYDKPTLGLCIGQAYLVSCPDLLQKNNPNPSRFFQKRSGYETRLYTTQLVHGGEINYLLPVNTIHTRQIMVLYTAIKIGHVILWIAIMTVEAAGLK